MRHNHCTAAGNSIRHFSQRASHPISKGSEVLAARSWKPRILRHPALCVLGISLTHLCPVEAFPFAEPQLAQAMQQFDC